MLSGNYALTSPEQRRGGGKCHSVGSLLCCAVSMCMCAFVYVCMCVHVCAHVCMHSCVLSPTLDVFAKGKSKADSVYTEVPYSSCTSSLQKQLG